MTEFYVVEKNDWQGFLKESKSYMDYPKCGRWLFWRNYPVAFLKFWFQFWQSRCNRIKNMKI